MRKRINEFMQTILDGGEILPAEARELANRTQATVVPFSTTERVEGAYLDGEVLYFKDGGHVLFLFRRTAILHCFHHFLHVLFHDIGRYDSQSF